MNNSLNTESMPNQPTEYDAVLGGTSVPCNAAVLGGIAGIKQRLAQSAIDTKIEALKAAVEYGQQGLELITQALSDKSQEIRHTAYWILKCQNDYSRIATEFEKRVITSPKSLFEDLVILSKDYQKEINRYTEDRKHNPTSWEQAALKVNSVLNKTKLEDVCLVGRSLRLSSNPYIVGDVLDMVFDFSPFKDRDIYKSAYAYHKVYLKGDVCFLGKNWWYAHYLWAGSEIITAQNYSPTDAPIASGIRYRVFKVNCTPYNDDWTRIGTYQSQEKVEKKVRELQVVNRGQKFKFINEPILPTKKVKLYPGHYCRSYRTGKKENYEEIPIGSENAIHPDL